MREEDKKILIRTYQNTIVELELGAEKLKEAGSNASGRISWKMSAGGCRRALLSCRGK